MITDNELSHAATVLDLLMQQHATDPASAKTSELFDTLIILPGAYAVVKHAQEQNEGSQALLAFLEGATMVLDRSFSSFREEVKALKALSLQHRKERLATINELLEFLKKAESRERISEMRQITDEIVGIGIASKNPQEILDAIQEFAKKEPQLAGTLGIAMKKIKLAARASFMERLADMRKDFPNAKNLRAPKPGKPGQLPMPCKN